MVPRRSLKEGLRAWAQDPRGSLRRTTWRQSWKEEQVALLLLLMCTGLARLCPYLSRGFKQCTCVQPGAVLQSFCDVPPSPRSSQAVRMGKAQGILISGLTLGFEKEAATSQGTMITHQN